MKRKIPVNPNPKTMLFRCNICRRMTRIPIKISCIYCKDLPQCNNCKKCQLCRFEDYKDEKIEKLNKKDDE